MERKTPELSCWLKPLRTKPKTHSFQSFVSWQFTVLPWHRHAGLWLHVSASEAAPSIVQHVIDLDSLKNHVLGWLMWQIRVTPRKYMAVDHKPSGFNVVKASWNAKLCNGVVISPWNHAWCRIYSTGCHVCCLATHSQHQPLMLCTQEFVVVGFVGEHSASSAEGSQLVKTLFDVQDCAGTWQLVGYAFR